MKTDLITLNCRNISLKVNDTLKPNDSLNFLLVFRTAGRRKMEIPFNVSIIPSTEMLALSKMESFFFVCCT